MDAAIDRIEWASLQGRRPRHNGKNARLGDHGIDTSPPIARIRLTDGSSGFGWSRISKESAESLIGSSVNDLFEPGSGCTEQGKGLDFALWDLAGKRAGVPVYRLLDPRKGPMSARCYDTSLYMNDLGLSDQEAVEMLSAHTQEGIGRGHSAFKIKVGRGSMHMDLEEGTRRDIAIINAVSDISGVDTVMIDANDGYNLNITKRVLSETASSDVYWVEEAFREDPVLYQNLREWMAVEGMNTRIADGEGDASPHIQRWAREGIIDILQYDLRQYGFTEWVRMGRQFDSWGVASAPHNYGEATANYYACHLAAAIKEFAYVEWDDATVDGLSGDAYSLSDGLMSVPDLPGFGLDIDSKVFSKRVHECGFTCGRV